jgi:hypothetical protein
VHDAAAKSHPANAAGQVLLNGTRDVRENIICVRADQPNGPDNDDQNNGEHYGIFRNVLAFVIAP